MRLLVVEDDVDAAASLGRLFAENNHQCVFAHDGEEGLAAACDEEFDAMIVDRMLPCMDGLAMVERLRREGCQTPALFLSALGDVNDRVSGLKAGGDDYLAKPYEFPELIARIEALVRRRRSGSVDTTLHVGALEMDLIARLVRRSGRPIDLQPREFQLLEFFMRHPEQSITRTMLLEKVWGYHFDPQTNVIDVHISRLRSKLDRGFERPMLQTVRGSRYRLEP